MLYITEEEMEKVTELIKEEGRISINRLTKLCDSIISMNQ